MIQLTLTTKKIYTQAISMPVSPIDFVKPVSYEFRVVEDVSAEDKVVKVRLQLQIWEHDEFGSGTVKQYWTDVPRIKMKEGIIIHE